MANGSDSGEHRVRIPARGAFAGPAGEDADAPPEKWLNHFVRAVVLIERLGNELGTLAFTWATVVLLGGYPTKLEPKDDFGFATAIVFLEAARMFSRNNRLDYQLFFNTRGALRPPGWNGLVLIVCISSVLSIISMCLEFYELQLYFSMAIQLVIGRFLSELCPQIPRLVRCNFLRRATSLWAPLAAVLLRALYAVLAVYAGKRLQISIWLTKESVAACISYLVLSVIVLLLTISRLRFPRIIELVDTTLGSKAVFWRQIPAAVMRVVLAQSRLTAQDNYHVNHDDMDKENLVPSLHIFYGMVLGQGMLYLLACILEVFSFIPRRSLIRSGGFRGQWGVESVNMYYAYALEKCMQGGVLAPEKICLRNFAMSSVHSDSSKYQLFGIRILNCFLQREPAKAELLSKLNTSKKTMARIIKMLNWSSSKDKAIRLYAAKVTAELAKNLLVVPFPGTMQLVCALLEADSRPRRGSPLLDTDHQHEGRQDPFLSTEDKQEEIHGPTTDAADNLLRRQDQLRGTEDLVQTQTVSTQQVGIDKQNFSIIRCWQRISEFWLIPNEQLLTDHDLLPSLAMSIIESLADCDQANCVEISKAAYLIPKIIDFTSYRSDTKITEAQQKVLLESSLKVLQRLTSIGGEIGITLRYEISKKPFILTNLTAIFGDSMSSQELRKLVAEILRNLAIDGNTRQEIGRIQLIITMLMQVFLKAEGTMSATADRILRKVAGQALVMLTTDNLHNCLLMLEEPEFTKKLKTMILIWDGTYKYVAASLLRNLCLYAPSKFRETDLKELSHTLREVIEKIMDEEGPELEILIGLSSQICKVIPEHFTRELEDSQIQQRFVKKLASTLNANRKPSAHCPGIRRVILEQVIYMKEYNSCYADCLIEFRMPEAISIVERTMSKAENYKLFLGDTGFMEYSTPLSALVARAKELTDCVL